MDQAVTKNELHILMLEDTSSDAQLMERELRKAGIVFIARRVNTRDAFVQALEEFHPDIILSDYKLPNFDGMTALAMVRHDHPDVPVIMVTGALPDVDAVELIHAGAKDYVLKDRLSRLATAVQHVLSVEDGIRARKAAEKALRESFIRYTSVTDGANDAIVCVRPDGTIHLWNKMAEQMFGYSEDEAIGKPLHQLIVPARYHSQASKGMEQFILSGTGPIIGKTLELVALHRDATEFPVEISISAMNLGGEWHATGIIRDITERKKAETELLRLNRAYRMLSAGNRTLLRANDVAELMNNMCKVITVSGGYLLAWIGLARQDENKNIEQVAISGAGKNYVEALKLTWDDRSGGHGPSGIAVRSGVTQIVQDIKNDSRFEYWREAAERYGYDSIITLPLKENGVVFGVLNIYAAEASAFSGNEVILLEEVADDLAFGIVSLRISSERDQAVEERQHHAEQLRASMEDTLQAISSTVEMRDPYTAGHQRRVADIAVAIARELGLPEDQVQGIHLTSIVHDLGKIHIPAEVLSKPGRLSEIEFSFIKTHPQAGYDILKEIKFPWPIAQAVLQHHERLDGSGYPQGLKGDAIILEARILAVADVVEAMASHRPYRPGLGLDAALSEITDKRGIHFDSAVVDACLKIIHEQGYALPT